MTESAGETGDLPPVFESLTAKQREAVRAATVAGFYARPQEATAEEVAERLDLSRSTFLYHLRGAEERIFQQAFDDAPEDNEESN